MKVKRILDESWLFFVTLKRFTVALTRYDVHCFILLRIHSVSSDEQQLTT